MSVPAGQTGGPRPVPLLLALVPVAVLVALLTLNVRVFGSGNNQVALVIAASVGGLLAVTALRQPWARIEEGITRSITMALKAVLILMVVGMLISSWIQSGVVPLLVVYGLELISPPAFLVTACLVCCVVSLASGSSWTTAGTVGIALVGIGQTLGIEAGLVGGAVVSGAYFGDKMSPLSDTTNLAPAMAGAELIEHIRHMGWTVTPALLGALGVYALMGGGQPDGAGSLEQVEAVVAVIGQHFTLSPWLLLPPVLVIALVALRFPALPALLLGTFGAAALGLVVQPLAEGGLLASLGSVFGVLYDGYSISAVAPAAGDSAALQAAAQTVTGLFDGRGGMQGMLGTVALVFCAMAFGGVMEGSGMLDAIAQSILRLVRGTGSLVAATIATCIGVNVLAADQYMAIVVPGRMFRTAYLQRGLHPKNLSRALEDSGTVTSALIPWNTCGAQMAAVLGIATTAYAPWAVLNWLCPLISIAYGVTGFTMRRISADEARLRLGATA